MMRMSSEICETPVFHIPLCSLEQVVSKENINALLTPLSPFMSSKEIKSSSSKPTVIAQAQ